MGLKKLSKIIFTISSLFLFSCEKQNQGSDSQKPTSTESLKSYVKDHKLKEGLLYTGYLNANNLPEDERGYLRYADGSSFAGSFIEGYPTEGTYIEIASVTSFVGKVKSDEDYVLTKIEGKLQFSDGQYYQGKFVNGLYEDEKGLLSYSHFDENGQTIDDFIYEGAFVAGSYVGQVGSLTFPAFAKKEIGLWYIGNVVMEAEKTVKANQECLYQIYDGSSSFKGEGYYDGEKCSYRLDVTYEGVTDFYNGCTYKGQYKNGKYEGEGEFVWDFPDGYSKIVGTFLNGTPVGQICTKYFPCNYTKTIGCWYFKGEMGSFESPKGEQQGSGCIRYEDKSLYIGDIYFNGDFASGFLRNGHGTIDGREAELNAFFLQGIGETLSSIVNDKLITFFDGEFSKTNGFINGNGVMYISKADKTPYGYITGNWLNWERKGSYEGELPEIREGFLRNLTEFI